MNGNNKPLVSIIVNCYNSDLYLKETLDSILSQTYQNWEIIFWDNQSKDRSAEYFNNYSDVRFKYFYAPEHTLLSTARNLAVEKANGVLLAFLDCDDIWYPNKLLLQVDFLLQKNIGFVYSKFNLLISSNNLNAKKAVDYYEKVRLRCTSHGPKNLYKVLLESNYIIFSSVLILKSIFQKIGGFKNDLKQNEDYEILLKISLIYLGVCIDYEGVQYRIHSVNNSHENDERNFIENKIIFSSLPVSNDLKNAKLRNKVRYGLFKILIKHDLSGVKNLINFHSFKYLIKIFLNRMVFKI